MDRMGNDDGKGRTGKRAKREDDEVASVSESQARTERDSWNAENHSREQEIENGLDEAGSPLTATQKKRRLEQMRRSLLHERMMELNELVMPGRPDWRKLDKELVMRNAINIITTQQTSLAVVREELASIKAENARLCGEKIELRDDKSTLRDELDRAKAECRTLRADNVALWQAMRINGMIPGLGRSASALDASNNSVIQKHAQIKMPAPDEDLATPEPGVMNALLSSHPHDQAAQRPIHQQSEQQLGNSVVEAPTQVPSAGLVGAMPSPDVSSMSPHSFGKWLTSVENDRSAQALFASLESDHLDLDGLPTSSINDWLQRGFS